MNYTLTGVALDPPDPDGTMIVRATAKVDRYTVPLRARVPFSVPTNQFKKTAVDDVKAALSHDIMDALDVQLRLQLFWLRVSGGLQEELNEIYRTVPVELDT